MAELTNGYCELDSSNDTLLEPDLDAIERDHMTKAKNIMKATFFLSHYTQICVKTQFLLFVVDGSCTR